MIVNKTQLADVLGVSQVSLTEWQKEDPPMPIVQKGDRRGQSHAYDTAVVIEWLIRRRLRNASIESPKDRLYRLQADEAQIRLEEKLGRLVAVETLEPALEHMVAAFRTEVLTLPDAIRDHMSSVHGVDVDVIAMDGLCRQVLQHLAAYDPESKARGTTPTDQHLPHETGALPTAADE